jgi:D-glycero-alpha-D-manno-heptose 1-phosphate guanylyltransferase
MEAIVLAGGLGTRLRKIVPDLPKPMAPVAGRPFLEIVLTSLATKGFERAVLSLGYMADKVIAHFGNSIAGMELDYEIESSPLGTGGALRRSLVRCLANHVFVFNGDTFLDLEVDALEAQWQTNANPIIVAREVADTSRYGRLDITAKRIRAFLEKETSGPGFINAGCYVLPRDILNGFDVGEAFSFEDDFLVNAVKEQHFNVFVTKGRFIDIGVPDDYARAQIELASIVP